MEQLVTKIAEAFLSKELTALNLVLLLATVYLAWQLASTRAAWERRLDEMRREAAVQAQTYSALATMLSELKGALPFITHRRSG